MNKPEITYTIQLSVEVPARDLFKRLQSELGPYFIDGTNNVCTWKTLSELPDDMEAQGDQEVRGFITSVLRCHRERHVVDTMAGITIGDVVFCCSE